jgi:hypothetical protein
MASRRRRRGYIEPLPSGSFRAVVSTGVDPLTGTPRYIRETAQTYDLAEVALTKLLRLVDEQQHPKSAPSDLSSTGELRPRGIGAGQEVVGRGFGALGMGGGLTM